MAAFNRDAPRSVIDAMRCTIEMQNDLSRSLRRAAQ